MTGPIAIILPRKEAFARDRFGAIALTTEAYTRFSRHRAETRILGMAVAAPRDPEMFRAVMPHDAWWRRRNLGFAEGCAADLLRVQPQHIDVHNRVEVFFHLRRRFPDAIMSLWFHNDPQETRGARSSGQRTRLLDQADYVVCVSEWVKARLLYGVPRSGANAFVFPEGVDVERIVPAAKENLIVYVGRLIPEKGVLPLAQALAQTLEHLPGWRVTVIGDGGRAPGYERAVKEALRPLGARAEMPGFLANDAANAVLARAAIAIVPSQWQEAFGRTAVEAMAAGCATIVSRRGALPDLIGDAGLIVDEPDAASLGGAIERLASDDRLRADLQARARGRALAVHDVRRWSAALEDLRDQMMSGQP